jgi:uncharacterized protein (TIGR00299 family) protein
MHLHLNPLGGLAGDMFCAALLDASSRLLPLVQEAVAAVAMPRGVQIDLEPTEEVLGGRRFRVQPLGAESEHRRHTPYRRICAMLAKADLNPGVRERALAIFGLLADAEARVHGTEPDSVEFHEVGSWDSIADIVGSAALLEALGVTGASCSPLPLGGGSVRGDHGILPVPAPATALLLEGLPVRDDGVHVERVTPTGAAILRSLKPRPAAPPGFRLQATGRGFGTRQLPGIPNCLQVLLLGRVANTVSFERDRVVQLRFEVDDQTPEDLAIGLDRLRDSKGVLGVSTQQAVGKKGRAAMVVEVLARPERLEAVAEACFRETNTIGLRHQEIDRFVLARDQRQVSAGGRDLGVKVVQRPGGSTAKVEADDLAHVTGFREREKLRRLTGLEALGQSGCGAKDGSDG